jgi:hypothetical protein
MVKSLVISSAAQRFCHVPVVKKTSSANAAARRLGAVVSVAVNGVASAVNVANDRTVASVVAVGRVSNVIAKAS